MIDIVRQMAKRPINVAATHQDFQGAMHGVAAALHGDQRVYAPSAQTSHGSCPEIQDLLVRLTTNHPSQATSEQLQIAMQVVEQIENDPRLKQRVIAAARGEELAGLRALPIGAMVVGAIEGWLMA